MKHEPEFQKPRTADSAQAAQAAQEMAACYARVFLGDDDGKRVLADLQRKFGLTRLVFQRAENGRYDTVAAALVDGERHVLSEIENALRIATKSPLFPTTP